MPRPATAQRDTIVIDILRRQDSARLGYSVIAALPGLPERFTDSEGHATLHNVEPGRVSITAKHIGYLPLDTSVVVAPDDTLRLRLVLDRVAIELPRVYSLAQRCSHPGGPRGRLPSELELLLDQVKQNADRNRLLADSFPYELTIERKITKPEPVLEARFVAFDTVLRSSARDWHYAPGKMLGTRDIPSGVFGGHWYTVIMPELADFADPRFLDNHCFDYAGIDAMDGDTLIRVDFVPAPVVHDLEVAGTLYLERDTYQLRVTLLNVVNISRRLSRDVSAQSIRAVFREVLPGIAIVNTISSMTIPPDDSKKPPAEPATEDQRVLAVRFLRGRP